jgi:hypothetical protein
MDYDGYCPQNLMEKEITGQTAYRAALEKSKFEDVKDLGPFNQ